MRGWTWLNRLDSQNPNQGSIFVNRGPKEWVHFEWFPHHRVSFFIIYSIMKSESNGVNPVFCMERSLILCGFWKRGQFVLWGLTNSFSTPITIYDPRKPKSSELRRIREGLKIIIKECPNSKVPTFTNFGMNFIILSIN